MVLHFFQKKLTFNFANKANCLTFASLLLLLTGSLSPLSATPEKSGEESGASVPKTHQTESLETTEDKRNQLPRTVLAHLLSFLKGKERKTFKELSKGFYQLAWSRATSCTLNSQLATNQFPLALTRIAQLTQNSSSLRKISFWNCSNLSSDGLAFLSQLQHLTDLNLGKCSGITDLGLARLVPLSSLRSLDLESCYRLTDEGLTSLSKLERLEDLDLNFCNTAEKSISSIAQLTNLRNLKIRGEEISDKDVLLLSTLSNLTKLDMSAFQKITNLNFLPALSKLTCFQLTNCKQVREGFSLLSHCSNLERLDLIFCPGITNDNLLFLDKLLHLKWLLLSSCDQISEQGFHPLFKVPSLKTLKVRDSYGLTNANLTDITQLSNLTILDLGRCHKITSDGIIPLSNLSNLTTLELGKCDQITDDGVIPLSNLSCLTSLNLSGCSITDLSLDSLMTLSNLRYLHLRTANSLTEAKVQKLIDALPKTEIY